VYKRQLVLERTNNASINRIRHIIRYLLIRNENGNSENDDQLERKIRALNNNFTNTQTFIEKAYSDLLIAQELYAAKRFTEIYHLLKKYENQLYKLEVLEMRIFLEAFIQVGAYKAGDPLGPALQYMAIKKCRKHGFSRLENNLLNYLDIQGSDTLKLIS